MSTWGQHAVGRVLYCHPFDRCVAARHCCSNFPFLHGTIVKLLSRTFFFFYHYNSPCNGALSNLSFANISPFMFFLAHFPDLYSFFFLRSV